MRNKREGLFVMTEAKNADQLTPLQRDIVEVIVENWTRTSTVLPLARLGQMLGARGYNVRVELAGRKLAEVIRDDLSSQIRLVDHPTIGLLLGAVPADAQIDGDIAKYFQKPQSTVGTPASYQPPRFHRGVWLAFTREIGAGYVRTLALDPKPQFRDVGKDAADASGKYCIDASDIVAEASGPASAEVIAKVAQSITDWAGRNRIPIESLLHRSYVDAPGTHPASRLQGNLLEQVLRALSDEELKTVQLPLNVVKKLLMH